MNATIDRGLVMHAVIAVAVCIGAWMLLVQPQIKSVQAAEAAVAANSQAAQSVNHQVFEKSVQKMNAVRIRIAEIENSNSLMNDSSRLYGQIMDLAAKHDVIIQNLQPGSAKLSTDTKMSIYRIDMSAQGSFEHIADFLSSISSIEGYIRPVSLNVVPTRDAAHPDVIAQFSCEALSFKLPEALTAIGGANAKP